MRIFCTTILEDETLNARSESEIRKGGPGKKMIRQCEDGRGGSCRRTNLRGGPWSGRSRRATAARGRRRRAPSWAAARRTPPASTPPSCAAARAPPGAAPARRHPPRARSRPSLPSRRSALPPPSFVAPPRIACRHTRDRSPRSRLSSPHPVRVSLLHLAARAP